MNTVSASAKSFKTSLQEVQIRIHERIKVDLTLEVGVVAEQVRITAEAPQLEVANANLGQVIEGGESPSCPCTTAPRIPSFSLRPGWRIRVMAGDIKPPTTWMGHLKE